MAERALLKEFEVAIDLKKTLPTEPFEVVEGDTGNRIVVTLTDDGAAVPLDDMLVTAVFSSSRGVAVQDSTDGSVTLSGNTATIALRPGAFAPKRVDCELQLYSSAMSEPSSLADYDVLVTTARFTFDCREAMLDETAIAALPAMPELSQLLSDISAAEELRCQAESAREAAFAELAAAFRGCITGEGAPSSATEAAAGQLYLDTSDARAYICTSASPRTWKEIMLPGANASLLKASGSATYAFTHIPAGQITLRELINTLSGWYSEIAGKQDALTFDAAPVSGSVNPVTGGGIYEALHESDWRTVADTTTDSASASVSFNAFGTGYGSGGFAFDELRLTIIGAMTGGSAVRIKLNGSSDSIRFTSLTLRDVDEPDKAVAVVKFEKPRNGFAFVKRAYSGDADGEGYASSNTMHFAALYMEGLTAYTALLIACEGSAKFAAGTRFVLEGRNR